MTSRESAASFSLAELTHLEFLASHGARVQAQARANDHACGVALLPVWRATMKTPRIAPGSVLALLVDRATSICLPVSPGCDWPRSNAGPNANAQWNTKLASITKLVWRHLTRAHDADSTDTASAAPIIRAVFGGSAHELWSDTDGDSADLAIALDLVRLFSGKPMRTICATGVLGDDGSVRPVDHLDAKLGAHVELDDPSVVFVIPLQRGGTGTPHAGRTAHGHQVHEVATLGEAIQLAFGTATPRLAVALPLLRHIRREADYALNELRDINAAHHCLTTVDLEQVQARHPLIAAELNYRLCSIETHRGNSSVHLGEFRASLATARDAMRRHELDNAEQRHFVQAALVCEVASMNDEGPQETLRRMRQVVDTRSYDGVPLGPDLVVQALGTLALAQAIACEHADALETRRRALELAEDEALGSHATAEAARTRSHLLWEAARAHDFELAESLVDDVAHEASTPLDAQFFVYNALRFLERAQAFGVAVALVREGPRFAHAPLVFAALAQLAPRDRPAPEGNNARPYPLAFSRRVLARAHRERGDAETARTLLDMAQGQLDAPPSGRTSQTATAAKPEPARGNPVLRWYAAQIPIERMLLEAALGESARAEAERRRALDTLTQAHAPLAAQYSALVEAVRDWTPAGGEAAIRAELARLYY